MLGPAGDHQLAIDVAGIDQMLGGEQPFGRHGLVERGGLLLVGGRGRGGLDMGDQVGRVRLTGLGQVDLVAQPVGAPLDPVVRLRVVRRDDPLGGRGQLGRGAPAPRRCRSGRELLLRPDLAQEHDRRHLAQPGRRGRAPRLAILRYQRDAVGQEVVP